MFAKLIDDISAGRPVKPGPQINRQLSAPEGGLTTLTDPSLYSGERKFTRQEPPPVTPPPSAPETAKAGEVKDITKAPKPAGLKETAKAAADDRNKVVKKTPKPEGKPRPAANRPRVKGE
jgi:NADH-quinone oxidoreductase subunit E